MDAGLQVGLRYLSRVLGVLHLACDPRCRALIDEIDLPGDDVVLVVTRQIHQPDVAPEVAEHEDDLIRCGDWRGTWKVCGHQHFSRRVHGNWFAVHHFRYRGEPSGVSCARLGIDEPVLLRFHDSARKERQRTAIRTPWPTWTCSTSKPLSAGSLQT
jgi:hypothetical protein